MSSDDGKTRSVAPDQGKGMTLDDLETRVSLSKPVGKLTVVKGPGNGQSFRLDHSSYLIGRESGVNHIALPQDDSVHREHHAAIECRKDGSFLLHDMQRRNPVMVNGQQIGKSTPLKPGDEITIGSTTMLLSTP
jgi:pSer/pThr/pTyr-binding forkhead associated (FHA) protein